MTKDSVRAGILAKGRERGVLQTLGAGAAWGIAIWSSYAVLEFLVYSVLPLYRSPDTTLTRSNWRIYALFLVCYWVLGVVGGALGAAFATLWSRGRVNCAHAGRLGASLSLLVGMAATLCRGFDLGRSEIVVLVVALAFSAAILYSLRNPDWRLAQWMEIHPILLAALLMGPTWVGTEGLDSRSNLTKALAEILLLAAVLGIQAATRRAPRWNAGWHFFASLALFAVLIPLARDYSGAHRAFSTAAWPAIPSPQKPPVVLVSLDTTRADHMSLYGYPVKTTPHLEELASGATLYTEAISASDMTLSSHASMFTGVYPSWHGAHLYTLDPLLIRGLDGKLPTLAGMLSSKGCFAVGLAANIAFLNPFWGLDRGFSTFTALRTLGVGTDRVFNLRYGVRRLLNVVMPSPDYDTVYRRAGDINDDVYAFLDRIHPRDRSFFLFVNYMDAHMPYLPPVPFQTTFAHRGSALGAKHLLAVMREAAREAGRRSPELAQLISQYDAGIAYEDDAFGQLMRRLKDLGIYDEALIVVTADHGEAFGERGLIFHGTSVYADQTHVPMLIKYPHQRTPAVVSEPVSHVDILPTVMDTLGYPVPPHVQGRTLRDVQGLAGREVVSESFPNLTPGGGQRIERAIRSGAMKLIVSTTGRHELYDLSTDPAELRNLRSLESARAAGLETSLQQWIGQIPGGPSSKPTLDEAEIRRLKSLGYLQ